MEIAKIEAAAIEKTIAEIGECQFHALNDLELVMVGGGQGDISLG